MVARRFFWVAAKDVLVARKLLHCFSSVIKVF